MIDYDDQILPDTPIAVPNSILINQTNDSGNCARPNMLVGVANKILV